MKKTHINQTRVTPDSKRGRQHMSTTSGYYPDRHESTLTAEQQAWNARVERERQAKKAKR